MSHAAHQHTKYWLFVPYTKPCRWDFELTAAEMVAIGGLTNPYPPTRGEETASLMCVDEATGMMGRCMVLDENPTLFDTPWPTLD
jgi:hypothetical protein